MPISGKLTKANIGFSMPGQAPLYPAPPYRYKGMTLLVFTYLTDLESAATMLPAQSQLYESPQAPGFGVAGLVFADYPQSDLGPYQEVVQFVMCLYGGDNQPIKFPTFLYVTTDVAMASGREVGGYPKKIAGISVRPEGDGYVASLARPADRPLASARIGKLQAARPLDEQQANRPYLTLRIIPSPEKDTPPTVAQLLLSDWQIQDAQVQEGEGECMLTGESKQDPLQLAPILRMVSSEVVKGDLLVGPIEPDPRNRPF